MLYWAAAPLCNKFVCMHASVYFRKCKSQRAGCMHLTNQVQTLSACLTYSKQPILRKNNLAKASLICPNRKLGPQEWRWQQDDTSCCLAATRSVTHYKAVQAATTSSSIDACLQLSCYHCTVAGTANILLIIRKDSTSCDLGEI